MKKILFVGSEAIPFAATGGLADVLGSLPAALMREDPELDVRVVIPMYQVVSEKYKEKSRLVSEFTVQLRVEAPVLRRVGIQARKRHLLLHRQRVLLQAPVALRQL